MSQTSANDRIASSLCVFTCVRVTNAYTNWKPSESFIILTLNSYSNLKKQILLLSDFKDEELKYKESKYLAQGHHPRRQRSRDRNPGSVAAKAVPLATMHSLS